MKEYIAKEGYLYVAKDDKKVLGKKLMTSNIDLFELVEESQALKDREEVSDEQIN